MIDKNNIIPFICFQHFLRPRELYSLVFLFKKNQPSEEIFDHFEWTPQKCAFSEIVWQCIS
jgi:hypothetical protein